MLLELGHDRGFLASYPHGPYRHNMRVFQFRAAVGDVSPAYLGVIDETSYWNSVFKLYRQDELQGSIELLDGLGIGMYGDYAVPGDIIYLEAATSVESEIVCITDRLEIEVIRNQLPFAFEELASRVRIEYARIRDLFGSHCPTVDTLLTLLLANGSIPTATLMHGYFAPKERFGKLCLPMPQPLEEVVRSFSRELAYQLAFETSAGKSDLWLLEAATAIADADVREEPKRWLAPDALDHALCSVSEEAEAIAAVRDAQAQCGVLGRGLIAEHGVSSLVRMLHEHQNAKLGNATSHSAKVVYGRSTPELFKTFRAHRNSGR